MTLENMSQAFFIAGKEKRMTKATKKQRALTMSLVFVMVFSLLFPVSTDKVHAFTGKKGSTYEVVDGGQIWYGTGAGGSSTA